MKLRRAVLPLLAGAPLLAGCDFGQPRLMNGGTLVMALAADPSTLNPFVATDSISQRAVAPLFPLLYQAAPDLSMVPDLAAEMPRITDSGKTWTVKLRRGARWSDGQPITAEDVVSTVHIQQGVTGAHAAIFDWTDLDKVEKVDDYTVRFTLTEAYAPFLADSLATFVAPAHIYGIIDPARMRNDPIGQQPVVSGGPFRFEKRVPGQEIDLAANPDFYAGRPHLDRIVEKVIPDPSSAVNALLDGRVQWQPDTPPAAINHLRGSGTFTRRYPDLGYYDVRFNDRPDHLFGDKRVRQAFAYAIDKESIVRQVTGGNGTVVWGDILPTHWAYDEHAVVKYRPNLAKARQLMQQAGWTIAADGVATKAGVRFSASFYVRNDAEPRQRAVDLMSKQAALIGMELKPTPVDFATFFEPLKQGKFDIAFTGFSTGPDPDDYRVFHSSQLRPENNHAGVNWTGYSNPELDRLINAERTTIGRDDGQTRQLRRKIFSQIEHLLGEDVVTYFMWADDTVHGFSGNVGGVDGGPGGSLLNLDYGRNVRAYALWYLQKS